METKIVTIVLLAHFIFAISLIIRLWRRESGYIANTLWSVIILIPIFGPILYGAFFNPPESLPPHKRQGVHEYVAPFSKEIIDITHGVDKSKPNSKKDKKQKKNEPKK